MNSFFIQNAANIAKNHVNLKVNLKIKKVYRRKSWYHVKFLVIMPHREKWMSNWCLATPKTQQGAFYTKKIFLCDIAIGKECREMLKISGK